MARTNNGVAAGGNGDVLKKGSYQASRRFTVGMLGCTWQVADRSGMRGHVDAAASAQIGTRGRLGHSGTEALFDHWSRSQ